MKCQHCGGLMYKDKDGVLACFICGRRRYPSVDPDKLKFRGRSMRIERPLPSAFLHDVVEVVRHESEVDY